MHIDFSIENVETINDNSVYNIKKTEGAYSQSFVASGYLSKGPNRVDWHRNDTFVSNVTLPDASRDNQFGNNTIKLTI